LRLVVNDAHARVRARQLVEHGRRAVGAAVVDDDDLEVVGQRGQHGERVSDQTGDARLVVVTRGRRR
jgi:hypothetical protein